jgi:hypothetical protein
MGTEEKQMVISEWDKHIEKNSRKYEIASFSSVKEEEYRKGFRRDIVNFVKLTLEEKLQILKYTGL